MKLPRLEATQHPPPVQAADVQPQERYEDELIMHLERDQFVAETSRPLPPVALTRRAAIGLWGLRIFVTVVGLMVIYTFFAELH